MLAEPTALRAERLARERELIAGLGLGDVVAARGALAGIDLDALAAVCEEFLVRTADLYREALGERLRAFVRDQAFAKLAVVRRYAAKLCYELELFRAPRLEAGAGGYVETLTAATQFRYAPEDYLLDLDDGFYAARYLRAWQLEAGLAALLTERFDEDWFRNPRAGPFVAALMARGQRDAAAALTAEVLGRPLDFGPLAASCEAGLA